METEQLKLCPLCRTASVITSRYDETGTYDLKVECRVCRPYCVSGPLLIYLRGKVGDEHIPVVKALRDKFAKRSVSPEQDLIELTFDNWKAIALGDER